MTREELLDAILKFRNPDNRLSVIAIGEKHTRVRDMAHCELFIEVTQDGEIVNVVDRRGILDVPKVPVPLIDDLTVADIKERLDTLGVEYTSSMKKADLFDLLVKA